MRIDRPRARRRTSLLTIGCGCFAALGVVVAIVLVAGVLLLPQILSRVAGLQPEGQTSALFAQITPQPTPVLLNSTPLPQLTVDLGSYGQQTITNNDPQLYSFSLGTTSSGQQAAEVSFTEEGLMQLCQERSTLCTDDSTDPNFSNAHIDLKPDGAIVYVDTTLNGLPIPAGLVMKWDESTKQIVVTGVDIAGTLYSPTQPSLVALVQKIQTSANNLIQEVAVEADSGSYHVQDVISTENTLTVVLQ